MSTSKDSGGSRQERVANKVGIAALAKAIFKVPAFLRAKDVSGWAKGFVIFSGIYLISPIDLIPDLLFPVVGFIDDVAIVGLALKLINDKMGVPLDPEEEPAETDEDVIDVDAKVVDE
jgi:uncharacterized membrane protein YkvA (DUF1232 family)